MTKCLAWNFSRGKTSQRGRGGNQFMVQLWWVFPLGGCLDMLLLLPFLFRYVLRKETEHRGKEKTNEGFFFNYLCHPEQKETGHR